MTPVTSSTNGLSYLTQAGGPLSNLPAAISPSTLESATPQDLVTLSANALQTQDINGLLGLSQDAQSTPPGISSADLSNATPQEQATITDEASIVQQVQALFTGPANTSGAVNLIG